MVYCGKASLGCQNCRKRRIKCDKVIPQCSQCIRAGKQCPGYRDPVSMMFRDESSKVIRRAHALWGREPGESEAGPSSQSPQSDSSSSPTTGDGSSVVALTPSIKSEKKSARSRPRDFPAAALPKSPDPTPAEKGVQFYIEQYLIGHPDGPRNYSEVSSRQYVFDPAVRNLMAAVGLAGLSNLNQDEELRIASRTKYGTALQATAKALTKPPRSVQDISLLLRSIVMLAMFEVVKGASDSAVAANAHVMGALAFLRSALPMDNLPTQGFRGLAQLCYSMLIPCFEAGVPIPPSVVDWLDAKIAMLEEDARLEADLLLVMIKFLRLSAVVRRHALRDGRPITSSLIGQALKIDEELGDWETRAEGRWRFTVLEGPYPPEACFHGRYHRYIDMPTARIWNHYRWARIHLNEIVLDFTDEYPVSTQPLMPAERREACQETVRRLAEDVLVSIPSHWRHPRLNPAQRDEVATTTPNQGGPGSAGVPATLYQLKTAARARGVPEEYGMWSLGVMETVWAQMGMLQARALAEELRTRLDAVKRRAAAAAAEPVFKSEPVD